jgi:integrase/recombinase XerD
VFVVNHLHRNRPYDAVHGRFEVLLDELLESFIHSRRNGLSGAKGKSSDQTILNYKQNLKHFTAFIEARGKFKYEDIGRNDVRAFIEAVNTNPKWKSEASKLTVLRVLRTLFRFVEKDEECQEDELKSWAKLLPPIPRNPRRIHIPTPKELKVMRNGWDTDDAWGLRNFVATSFMLGTGQRINEVCHTKMEHLQLDNKLIYVPEEGKTGSRLVPLDDQLVKLLRMWIRKRARLKGSASPYLFIGRGGTQCTRNTFGQAFRKLQKGSVAGKRITPHVLRHSFGTYYLRNGGGMEKLRMITGHSTYEAMKGYLHLAQVGSDEAKEELARVSPLKMLDSVK